ncbi:hypothetical protein FOA43_002756 [Brettanomyces nanus]|uniref:Uncharacterized protein n=1 Tax=Eeniella nana TaxID=13502 RepID=A0A875S5V6_EENNA|nr:uncharacterized protein FOA43_002756 [Brettanomyces nanus]QPG75402.1 hypothetical protein FOA43_002756 [Brettanomyces nanus]
MTKMSMSISSTYALASKVKARLTKEAVKNDVNLNRLVCQANMLDSLIENLNEQYKIRKNPRAATISFDSISVNAGNSRPISEDYESDDIEDEYVYGDEEDEEEFTENDSLDSRSRIDKFYGEQKQQQDASFYGKITYYDSESESDSSDSDYSEMSDTESELDSDSEDEEEEEYEGGAAFDLRRMPSHSEESKKESILSQPEVKTVKYESPSLKIESSILNNNRRMGAVY